MTIIKSRKENLSLNLKLTKVWHPKFTWVYPLASSHGGLNAHDVYKAQKTTSPCVRHPLEPHIKDLNKNLKKSNSFLAQVKNGGDKYGGGLKAPSGEFRTPCYSRIQAAQFLCEIFAKNLVRIH